MWICTRMQHNTTRLNIVPYYIVSNIVTSTYLDPTNESCHLLDVSIRSFDHSTAGVSVERVTE